MRTNSSVNNTVFHTAIVGAGASGLFCAGSFDAPKIVLDASQKPAQKVSVSGGGKCNFSNKFISAAQYMSQNKHFCKSALAAFKSSDFTNLLDEQHIPWQEREEGQLFAYNATDIVHFLIKRARQHHSTLALGTQVLDIQPQANEFLLSTSAGYVHARNVVLACGGLSYPQLGASSFGTTIARRLKLNLVEQRPVLCGLSFPKSLRPLCLALTGNSLPVRIRQGKHLFEGPLLFTHEGISGPVVLRLSLFWENNLPIEIDFLPGKSATEIIGQHKNSVRTLSSIFSPLLPGKIAPILLSSCDTPLAHATRVQLKAAANILHHFQFYAAGTSGYTKAEATAGGIDTRELNPVTLEARRIPGLFAIGELTDVTGNLGGFNLHWAWASTAAAAQALSKRY